MFAVKIWSEEQWWETMRWINQGFFRVQLV
jgi:hypothetical protein